MTGNSQIYASPVLSGDFMCASLIEGPEEKLEFINRYYQNFLLKRVF